MASPAGEAFAPPVAMQPRRRPASRHAQRGWAWLSWAIPAAAKLAGDLMGNREAKKANAQQWDLATRGLQYRAADARAAGLHPLAALGAGMPSYNPAIQTFTGLQSAGQDLGRAFMANGTQDDRDSYTRKELSQFDAKRASQQAELGNLELEMARLRLQRMQQEVQSDAQGFSIEPNKITAANPLLPSVAAGPAGPGFKATRIGNSTWDIGGSELSEWAEGAGLAGHALVPFWMYQQALARRNAELSATDAAHRGIDPAYDAALAEAQRTNGTVERGHHIVNGRTVWGWRVVPKNKSFFSPEEQGYWRSRRLNNPPGRQRGGASGSW